MDIKLQNTGKSLAVRLSAEENGVEVGHAYLYLIYNDLHQEPYGLLEDVFVKEAYRGKGLGTTLVQSVVKEAKNRGCYKLVATSRLSRSEVHTWYEKIGFKNYGLEFRMDF